MAAPSSVDIEKTAAMLSQELAAGKELRRFAKQADLSGVLSGLGDRWSQLSPTSKGLLAGTAGGALLGGLSSFGRDKEERQPLQSALTGGLAGGLLGGGLGLASQYGPQWFRDLPGRITGRARDISTDVQQGLASGTGPTSLHPLDPRRIAKMSPEELAAIDPQELGKSSLEAINAVEARQQELIEQAREGAASPTARGLGGLVAGAGGSLVADRARQGYRTRSWLGAPSDVARAWTEMSTKERAAMGMGLEDAEQLARKIVEEARSKQYPVGQAAGGRRASLLNRLRRLWDRKPEISAFPPKMVAQGEGQAAKAVASEKELVRRLLQEGRHARLSKFPKLRAGAYGLGTIAAILAGLYSANRAKQQAGQQMAQRLRIE